MYVGLVVLAALAEATVGHRLEVGAGRANLVLLMVATWSLIRGVEEGALAGLAGGVALDLVSGTPFGLYTGILTLIGAVTALSEATLYRGSLALFFGMAVLTTVCFHGVQVLVLQALGREAPPFTYLVRVLVPTVLINAILMPIIFSLAQRLFRALSGWRQLELE